MATLQEDLFVVSPEEYGDQYAEHCLEQYKTYVESAERISDRRQQANSFFLTVNTALLAAEGVFFERLESWSFILVGLAGALLCYTWYRIIRSYKGMNTGKFAVIHAIEERLPLELYKAEWKALDYGENPDKYLKFTVLEMKVPWLFIAVHAVLVQVGIVQVLLVPATAVLAWFGMPG